MGRGHISRLRRNLGSGEALPSHRGVPTLQGTPLISQGALGSILHHPEWWHPSAAPHLGLGYPMGQPWGRRSRTPLAPAALLPGAESCQALGVLGCSSPPPCASPVSNAQATEISSRLSSRLRHLLI